MDVLASFLVLGIGLSAGALLALLIDEQRLEQHMKGIGAQRERWRIVVKMMEKRLAITRMKLNRISTRFAATAGRASRLAIDNQSLREQLATIVRTLETTETELLLQQENVNRLNSRINQLESAGETWRQELDAALTKNDSLQESLNRACEEVAIARAENDRVCHQLTTSEIEINRLQQELVNLQQQVSRMPLGKEDLLGALRGVETRMDELKLQVEDHLHQVSETESLRQQLAEAKEKLETTRQQLEKLHVQLRVQNRVNQAIFQKKSKLEFIRGIGPTYARRLREAGINTLEDLTRQTPERLAQIVGLKAWQGIDPQLWISEARELVTAFNDGAPPSVSAGP